MSLLVHPFKTHIALAFIQPLTRTKHIPIPTHILPRLIMDTYSSPYYGASDALPIPTVKGQYQYGYQYPAYYTSGDSTYSVSPPEDLDASVSSGSGLASYGNSYSVTNASYASSSQGEYESAGSASGIDLNEYMQDRFAETFNPIPLDNCTVKQAQT